MVQPVDRRGAVGRAVGVGRHGQCGFQRIEYGIIVAGRPPMTINQSIDWSDCPLVEIKPGVQSGAAVLLGTRMPADAIVDNFDYGLSRSEEHTSELQSPMYIV